LDADVEERASDFRLFSASFGCGRGGEGFGFSPPSASFGRKRGGEGFGVLRLSASFRRARPSSLPSLLHADMDEKIRSPLLHVRVEERVG
jgi:hypothetical protein